MLSDIKKYVLGQNIGIIVGTGRQQEGSRNESKRIDKSARCAKGWEFVFHGFSFWLYNKVCFRRWRCVFTNIRINFVFPTEKRPQTAYIP